MDAITESDLLASFLLHQRDLQQFLTHKVNCAETAADLIQETYLRIARYSADGEIANQRAFVFRIADNLALDHLRSRARHEQRNGGLVDEYLVCSQPQPDSMLEEVNRYRKGCIVAVNPRLAERVINGVFNNSDPDAVVAALTATLQARALRMPGDLVLLY